MKEKEKSNRDKLRERKPKVLDKIIVHEKEQIPRIQLQWRTGEGSCNFNCSHCSVKNVGDNKELITLEEVKNLFIQADKIGISRMTISGGEPLTFELDKLVKAINSELFWIQLDTNCWLLDEEKIKYLKDLNIDCIAPSLDSLNFREHDKFRNKKGSAKRVIKAFDLIQKYEFNTYVQTVVTKSRLYSKEFIEFLKYFNERKIGVFVSLAKPVGNFSNRFDDLVSKKDIDYLASLEKEYLIFNHMTPGYGINEDRNCVATKNIFAVSSTGDCLPCIYWYCSLGNIKEEPFKIIYDRMQKLNIFRKNTCRMADISDNFINDYVVPLYGKELPVSYKEILTEKDFDK
jgi:MoaA/NifB/PqqE/SkfB family radical SAM enzyme